MLQIVQTRVLGIDDRSIQTDGGTKRMWQSMSFIFYGFTWSLRSKHSNLSTAPGRILAHVPTANLQGSPHHLCD